MVALKSELREKEGGLYLGKDVDPNGGLSWLKNKRAMGEVVRSSFF